MRLVDNSWSIELSQEKQNLCMVFIHSTHTYSSSKVGLKAAVIHYDIFNNKELNLIVLTRVLI